VRSAKKQTFPEQACDKYDSTFIVNGFSLLQVGPALKMLSTNRRKHRDNKIGCATLRGFRKLGLSVFLFAPLCGVSSAQPHDLELSRPAHPWEFFCATGTRAGVFGNESGDLEAWVYPLKIFRDFHVQFLADGHTLPAESLVRTVTVRPESSSIIYTGDTFSVIETVIVPVHEPGAIIKFEIETAHPLEIEASFERDFQLEWPAALGGTYVSWDPALHAFYFGEEQRKFSAFVGSPTGDLTELEYQTNYSASPQNALRLGLTSKGKETKLIAITASVNGHTEAENTYKHLLSDYAALERDSTQYYRDYLSRTASLTLPDPQLQRAYDSARVSVIQGLVTNPYLGTGLVAGYRTSGTSQRPGFAWYFGRDSFWTAQALDAEGDFTTARTALEFISKFQREDGKIPHEISQGANFVNWFKDYPYPYASADATPLYLIAANDYVTESGDTSSVREKWDSLWKAYQFLRSTYDSQGLPQNFGIGHGWVEGGPLLPVKTELYQSGLGAQALSALSNLARIAGKDDVSQQLADDFARQKQLVNQAFWSQSSGTYAFALDRNDQQVIEPSVLATVPMWFGLLDSPKAESMLNVLSGPDHEADWGMRIISQRSPRYDAGGYHFGSVWPLFTGWASVGEYHYHRAQPAYSNLRANALLALDGSPGHVTEVLSGDYYQPLSTSSPHQIWSAAMVISSLLRGMLGLAVNAAKNEITMAPHIPADWNAFAIHNVHAGTAALDLDFHRIENEITLAVESTNQAELHFSPAVSLRAQVLSAELNGRKTQFKIESTASDQHVHVDAVLMKGKNTLQVRLRNDFGVSYANVLPPLGSRSRGLRILSQTWSSSHESLTVELAGMSGLTYELPMWCPDQVASADGAQIKNGKLQVTFPSRVPEDYVHQSVTIHFVRSTSGRR
jgi:glycogen debranching enzyme